MFIWNSVSERHGIREPKKVEQLQMKIISSLRDHVTYNAEAQRKPHYFSHILGKLPELRSLSMQGDALIGDLIEFRWIIIIINRIWLIFRNATNLLFKTGRFGSGTEFNWEYVREQFAILRVKATISTLCPAVAPVTTAATIIPDCSRKIFQKVKQKLSLHFKLETFIFNFHRIYLDLLVISISLCVCFGIISSDFFWFQCHPQVLIKFSLDL